MAESTLKIRKNETSDKYKKNGLSHSEAESMLKIHGPNSIGEKKRISALKIMLDQFSDFMVMILLASTAISAFLGELTEAVTIIFIVIMNAILGFIQEFRTEKSMKALKELAAPSAKVIREGETIVVPAENIVPGDLLVLEAGDRIAADAEIIEVHSLQSDEALLTGESLPVEKKGADLVYMGTVITNGRGKAIVKYTGMNTEMGKIAEMLQNIEDEETPLQKKLEHLGKYIVYGCLFICAIVMVTGLLRGDSLFTMFLSSVSLAVAAIPEGLPAIITIALALGVQRMLKRNALIRKLPAVETLGCASVICSDKTGTLTENKMTVRKVFAGENLYDVTGNGYSLEGEFSERGKTVPPQKPVPLKMALEISALCNNAEIIMEEDRDKGLVGKIFSFINKKENIKVNGDPTEGALVVAACKGGIQPGDLLKHYMRIDELPFDSDRKCMSVICESNHREIMLFTKGAPDVILDKCKSIQTQNGIVTLTSALKVRISKVNESMAADALRVIAVGYRKLESAYSSRLLSGNAVLRNEELEKDLVFVGLMGMIDPPRAEAVEAIRKCNTAGIKTVMITGDHKVTAAAVAKELGIIENENNIMTGKELDTLDDNKLDAVINDISVYARVSPRHKLRIVKALKKKKHIVAMTGDGVNDAPAIKESDIGVSMGITGTDVTKEASAMVLMDDNFATIVAAVEEGRVIYSNIRKFIRYMLSCNIGEVLTMFLGALMGLPLPLIPIQILWVNLVTDGLPAIALGLEPAEKDVMLHKPRQANESIFSNGLTRMILIRGSIIGICTLGVFISIMYFTHDLDKARTAAFVTLCVTQLIHVFECKSERYNIFEIPLFNNMSLVFSVLISLAMLLAVIYIPVFSVIFKTSFLGLEDWLLILGFSFIGPLASSYMIKR